VPLKPVPKLILVSNESRVGEKAKPADAETLAFSEHSPILTVLNSN
jgi:hypothetical protein